MELTKKILDHIAKLSVLALLEKEEERYLNQLTAILAYISQLQGINTNDVSPTSQVTLGGNAFREDIVAASLTQEEALQNSLHAYKGYFKIPKVIE